MTEEEAAAFQRLSEKERDALEKGAVVLKRQMLALKEDANFIVFRERLDKQIGARTAQLLVEPTGLDSTVAMLYKSGMIAGIAFASNFIDTLIGHCEQMLAGKEARLEQEEKGEE